MAKAKKTIKKKTASSKKTVKVLARKSILHKQVDNRLSILLIVAALVVFVLAAVSMGK